ncbi:DUF1295 domain-containing protein [Novipirellula artificiosorum]|uniref:3-oxo-5-alpha-steroid 4-dehydrogenase n=1 Tax=Novipirellula artificiosorum TaxID=2528016 RepID=A0A5C6DWE2_9BACT|nr:DUF1295 domain-containing protein [Novipirellula artificiosorum]TWU40912.1 3-oxo-5-alpha-steroid 4-dehydrogenase [Novipirellula artificiosorum]
MNYFLTNFGAVAVIAIALWVFSLLRRNVNVVDVFWGLGFVVIAWLSLSQTGPASMRVTCLAAMVTVWGFRLASYLAWRNWGKPEDHRYAAMREKHGNQFGWVSLVTVFGLQALLMWFISLPIQVAIGKNVAWSPLVILGFALWGVGIFFEAVGDLQLARFKADALNRGKVMNLGLWRYTRHPNYFGDFLVWWGFYFVAVEPDSWWWTILSPIIMSVLLIRVSGVRLLESSLRSRVEGYEQYVKITSAFFPRPPKHVASELA